MPPPRLRDVAREPTLLPVAKDTGGTFTVSWPQSTLFGAFGGFPSNTGQPVTWFTALQSSPVWACVRCISEDIAKLPLLVRRRLPGGGSVTVPDHWLSRLLSRPNAWHTPFDFWSYTAAVWALRGNGYIAIDRNPATGRPTRLIPLAPDRVTVRISEKQGWVYYNVSHALLGESKLFHQDDMLHVRLLSLDGIVGVSPIAAAQDVVGVGLAAQQHGATLFRNGAQLNGILTSDKTLSDEARVRLAESWRSAYGGVSNSAKTAVLEEGLKFERVSLTSEEAQFLETRKFSVPEICRIFRVPPRRIGHFEGAGSSDIESENQSYIDDALLPLAERIEQQIESKLLFEDERSEFYVEFDFDRLLRGNMKSRYESYSIALNNGVLNRNEVRGREGLNPVQNGDEYRVPLNTGTPGSDQTRLPASGMGTVM